ncbi:hypothetical protein [Comamonas thiooxydans]|uniref:Uncharacterized protein n=1 Tax=Comamonas thiooxydans TaxID=363952 RepID=A0A0E3BYE5_9BURK|nr:hypothetical protein [Comamonas thiooxydans]KGG87666.1 hypothetical protein P245_19640 [Comamonas thiooxydans]KGH22985.1 hypothetical protein P606_13200 [Comamonas thiooxydans]
MAPETDKTYTSFKSLLNDKVIGKNNLLVIGVHLLEEEEGFNQRDYADPEVVAQIEAFASAYLAGSFVPPPIVRFCVASQRVLMVEGHLRRRGLILANERGAGIVKLECVPFRGSDADRVQLMLTSAQGLALKPVGVARSYLMLLRMGNDASEIARRLNRSISHVEDMLVLATANTDVQNMVNSGTVLQTNAIAAVRKYGDTAGPFLAGELVKARAQGKSKVTASSLKEWMPSAKLMRGIFDSAQPLISSLGQDVVQVVAAADPSNITALKGKTLAVDAYSMARFFLAMKDATDARNRRSQKMSEHVEKSKQISL